MSARTRARLELEDGSIFEGLSFGGTRSTEGEVVFTTGMAGYPQSLTDPSYLGQILVATYPLAGNYGVPAASLDRHGLSRHFESAKIWVSGLVVAEACDLPSHRDSVSKLSVWLAANKVPGIEGIDTRELTTRLRERGVMRGKILIEGAELPAGPARGSDPSIARVSCAKPMVYGVGGSPRIGLLDCGVKNNIIRCLLERGAEVHRIPWNQDPSDFGCDGLLVSNGPGDPKTCTKVIATLRRALSGEKPVFGICLGNQLMALAAGGDTYKLPYGHRAQNQPCIDQRSGRCYITSKNHGYAVREGSLPLSWETWFRNGNDGTVEGIRRADGGCFAVQFHPEGCPGPRDTEFLFDLFLETVRAAASPAEASA
jgi:carbamoyl-phosphate synthase small subunit